MTPLGGDRRQHDMLSAIWHMLKNDQPYRDPGGDYFERKDTDATGRTAEASRKLRSLGFRVELSRA